MGDEEWGMGIGHLVRKTLPYSLLPTPIGVNLTLKGRLETASTQTKPAYAG
jgi:hypothetical protein